MPQTLEHLNLWPLQPFTVPTHAPDVLLEYTRNAIHDHPQLCHQLLHRQLVHWCTGQMRRKPKATNLAERAAALEKSAKQARQHVAMGSSDEGEAARTSGKDHSMRVASVYSVHHTCRT